MLVGDWLVGVDLLADWLESPIFDGDRTDGAVVPGATVAGDWLADAVLIGDLSDGAGLVRDRRDGGV